jgi:glycine/D-amino acid oxidase-like deaminating enzyme/nitrite reductase/ring-hydroxylating ferredoxin subunit
MKRDGNRNSLWQDTTPENGQTGSTAMTPPTTFDVIIAGAGITGITTALELQKAGLSVMVAEAQTIGFGTTGGTTAHLNTFMDTPYHVIAQKFGKSDAALVARAAQDALQLIRSNVETYSIDCGYKELSAHIFSQDDKQGSELESIFDSSRECNVAVERTTEIAIPVPFEKALEFTGQATFHPGRYLNRLAEVFREGGGQILENCRITNVEEGEPHQIISSLGNFKARHFIYATHVPPGVNLLHFRCAPYRSYAIAVKLRDENAYPDKLVYDMYDPYHYYRTQEIDGEKYLIVGGEDHKTGHEANTEGCLRKLEAHVRKYFDVKEVTHQWSSQYYEPNDGLPYIGTLPGHPDNMYVATGYGGNGMIYSNVAAMTLTSLITGVEHDYISLFDPNRIKIVAGFSNFVKESADVVGKLIGKILPDEKLHELADLAPGEAKVVNYDGDKVAIYKDEQGKVFAVNSACTHIKCDVAWNNAEQSWDCPCHGSRFSKTGEVLTAPARKDLEQINIQTTKKSKNTIQL